MSKYCLLNWPIDGRLKYAKKNCHKKKELTDEEKIKKDWREFSRVRKDKAKRNYWRGDGGKNYYLRKGHRKMRTWVRERLMVEDYSLERGWKKSFSDPWMWD